VFIAGAGEKASKRCPTPYSQVPIAHFSVQENTIQADNEAEAQICVTATGII
jgi:hypothetical protein